jgi:hypothetical protein
MLAALARSIANDGGRSGRRQYDTGTHGAVGRISLSFPAAVPAVRPAAGGLGQARRRAPGPDRQDTIRTTKASAPSRKLHVKQSETRNMMKNVNLYAAIFATVVICGFAAWIYTYPTADTVKFH